MFRMFCTLLLVAAGAAAQDRAGNDTPGEWRTDHFESFGLWDSACDWRDTDGQRERRCYARYVDVFSPAPKFGAIFAFIEPLTDGHKITVGIEPGTRFEPDGFRVDWNGQTQWVLSGDLCLRGGTCVFEGDAASALIAALQPSEGTDGSWVFLFTDRHGQPQAREWDLSQMRGLLEDQKTAASARGLASWN